MRALPGRASRTSLPFSVTRATAKEDQRRRILRATGELVAERGYHAVTVELIVKHARVSFKTFYGHFSNKEECFVELFETVMAEARERMELAVEREREQGAPWAQQVAAALRALFDVLLADPLIARASIVDAPTVGPVMIDRYQEAMSGLTPLLRQGRELVPNAGELPPTLEDTLAGGLLWSAYQRLIVGEVDRLETLIPEAVVFVLRPYVGEREAAKWAKWAEERPAEEEEEEAASAGS
jgi:AcrR family transcriptional regulator